MKKFLTVLLVAAVAAPLLASATDVTVSADLYSAYVSRGTVCNDEPVLQPNIYFAGPAGFDFNLWATMDLTDNKKSCAPDTAWRWSEFDFTLGWNAPFSEDAPISLWLGSTFYTYPQFADDKDYDFAVSVSGNCILNPTVKFVHECDKSDNYRVDFSVSHGIELADALSLNLGAQCTYGFDTWMEKWGRSDDEGNVLVKAGDAGLVDVMVNATLSYQVTEAWSVSLIGAYSALIDGDARDAADIDDIDSDIFYGGVSTAYTF
ncbi:MAG: hypothetical protein IK066_02060 [Kiritimatiellae bacterium]|nr:hypothetical protein [Kiritimatiellia bacterium]